jgi:hypothetical protein
VARDRSCPTTQTGLHTFDAGVCRYCGVTETEAMAKIAAGLREAIDVAAGRPHNARVTFTAHAEFSAGGLRFAPGRYTIRRVDVPETGTTF